MLRYYQSDAKSAVLFALEEFRKVLLNLPTGAGKTVVAAHLISAVQPHRCLFLADQDELCQQPLTVIDRECGIIPALHKASKKASLNARIVVGSSQTLAKRKNLEHFPPGFFHLAIIDEAHRGTKRDMAIVDYLGCKVAGITATPFRSGLRDLSGFYEHVAYALPMLDLIGDGFAPPMEVMTLPVEIDLGSVDTKRGIDGNDYEAESLTTTIAPYYERIVELLKEHAWDRKTIIFLPLIKSSEAFAAIARRAGFQAIHVDGGSDDRNEIIEGFRRGRYQILCNANVVETGVDLPNADCIINLAPTRSMVKYQQRIGRGCRVLPGVIDDIPGKHQAAERRERIAASEKPNVLILDFLWQHDNLSVIRPGHLFANNEEDARAMYDKVSKLRSPEDLLAIAKLVQEEREAFLVKKLEAVSARKGSYKIEPAEFGLLVGDDILMNFDRQPDVDIEPASPAQLNKLEQWGFSRAQVTCRAMAHRLMGQMIHRFRFKFASINQMRKLRTLGVAYDARTLTMNQASRLISTAILAPRHEGTQTIPFE